jgi:Uma2 family endonuclease
VEQRIESISLKEFLDWEQTQEQKHELIHGRIVAFSGASKDHNHIAGNVYIALRARLKPPCTAYGSDMIIETISRNCNNGYRPDAVVSCSEEDQAGPGRYLKHARIVVEVRSPKSNFGSEWDSKLLEYSSTLSIEQLVIIEAETRAASSYLRAEQGGWRPPILTIGNGILRFPTVDVEMTLDEVYRLSTLDTLH